MKVILLNPDSLTSNNSWMLNKVFFKDPQTRGKYNITNERGQTIDTVNPTASRKKNLYVVENMSDSINLILDEYNDPYNTGFFNVYKDEKSPKYVFTHFPMTFNNCSCIQAVYLAMNSVNSFIAAEIEEYFSPVYNTNDRSGVVRILIDRIDKFLYYCRKFQQPLIDLLGVDRTLIDINLDMICKFRSFLELTLIENTGFLELQSTMMVYVGYEKQHGILYKPLSESTISKPSKSRSSKQPELC